MPPARKKIAAAADPMAADAAASAPERIASEVLVIGTPESVEITGAPGFRIDGYKGGLIAIEMFGRTFDEAVASCSAEATVNDVEAAVTTFFTEGRIYAIVTGAMWGRDRIDLKLNVIFR